MQAIAITPGGPGARMVERSEPRVEAEDEVKIRILQVGICGTDREEVSGGRAKAAPGHSDLVIGHEMFGQVVETGSKVTRVKPGDHAVFTVRRGCNKCLPCQMNRPDMCLTGNYTERGIWGRDGYQTEFVVDKEQYVVRVSSALQALGVLLEPFSVAEKAIDEALRVQQGRLPDFQSTPDWLFGKRCLVAGLGPIGLLAAMGLALRGAEVYGLDVQDANSARPQWLESIGGHYLDGRQVKPADTRQSGKGMAVIIEATGAALLEFNLLDVLAANGVYVLTGLPGGDSPLQINGAELIRRLVLNNQAMVGSVNAARGHFQMAADDLAQAVGRWPGAVEKLITARHKTSDFGAAFSHHGSDEIKTVIEWADHA